jgi:hypothetical protein
MELFHKFFTTAGNICLNLGISLSTKEGSMSNYYGKRDGSNPEEATKGG